MRARPVEEPTVVNLALVTIRPPANSPASDSMIWVWIWNTTVLLATPGGSWTAASRSRYLFG